MADKDKKKGKEKEKKEKEKEKEKDRDRKRTSSNAASEAPSFAAPAPQLSSNSSNDKIIKNERSAEGELFWRMWYPFLFSRRPISSTKNFSSPRSRRRFSLLVIVV